MVNSGDLPVTVNAEEGKMRLWRDTPLNAQSPGSKTELAPHTVGYESNEDLPNGFRPPGLIHLSTTTGQVPEYLQDFGNTVAAGNTTHHTTMYRAASGALVFSTGSVQWSWGLDQWHDGNGAPADSRMQQAQVNLLADMDSLPTTLMSGLVMPTAQGHHGAHCQRDHRAHRIGAQRRENHRQGHSQRHRRQGRRRGVLLRRRNHLEGRPGIEQLELHRGAGRQRRGAAAGARGGRLRELSAAGHRSAAADHRALQRLRPTGAGHR